MNSNETPEHDAAPSHGDAQASAPVPPASPANGTDGASADGASADGAPAAENAGETQGGGTEGGRRKKRRRGRGRGGEGAAPHAGGPSNAAHGGGQPHGGHHAGSPGREAPQGRSYVEDRLDKDAEQLARDARSVPFSRLRPLGILAQEVRRMVATGDARDAREARRALVLLKSRVAYLAGRESGKERSALVKVREFVFRGVDHVTRNQDAPDPQQLRNFLDGIEALVGYHRFHADDRRRD